MKTESAAYKQFKAAEQQLLAKAKKPMCIGQPVNHTSADLMTVDALQRNILTLEQLDALSQIQGAVRTMAQMQDAINQLATLNSLDLRRVTLPTVGMLWHEIEGLLWSHNSAAAKLRNGGMALREDQGAAQERQAGVLAA